jgi:hypothetical protein
MSSDILCHPYVWEDPRYLFHTLWTPPKSKPCVSELVNRIIFVYVLALIIGFLGSSFLAIQGLVLLTGVIATLLLLPTFLQLRKLQMKSFEFENDDSDDDSTVNEGFEEKDEFNQNDFVPPSNLRIRTFNNTGLEGSLLNSLGTSKARNPFNNILIDQIKYEPNRPAAEDITSTEKKIDLDDLFRVQWYSDTTDVFGKTQSQRMFITQPVTTIPNDQDSYQKWLYKIPGKSCKEGGAENCYAGTEGAALPWLNM